MNTRSRMMFAGVQSLSNAELLSVIIGTSEEKAREVLDYADSVSENIGAMEVKELTAIDGIGEAKACAILASAELNKRIACKTALRAREKITDASQLADIFREEVMNEKREKFMVVGLNTKLRMEWREVISIGSISGAPVHPREVFSKAVKRGSAAVIVAHNHPSGDPTPSLEDIEVTERLKKAGELIGIKLIDHIILGNGCYTSMKNEGFL